jgi:hypothetical protein
VIPQTVDCDDCGSRANVLGYGRVEYDWGEHDNLPTQVVIKSIRLTINCPLCGLKPQDHHPTARHSGNQTTQP